MPEGSVFIARPWREWTKCVLLDCTLADHIAAGVFDDWNKPHAHETMRFAEYESVGPGASVIRAPYVRRLDAHAISEEALLSSMP